MSIFEQVIAALAAWTFGPIVLCIVAIPVLIVFCWILKVLINIIRVREVKRQREWADIADTEPSELLPPLPRQDDRGP